MDIVFSGQFFGGIGGTEKKLKCLVESMPNARFHIEAGQALSKGFVPKTFNWYVNLPFSRSRSYDAAIVFCGGGIPDDLLEDIDVAVRFVDTNATPIIGIEDKFDYILVQTLDMDRFTDRRDKFLTTFPDPRFGFPKEVRTVDGLPEKYLLTVFNPFSKAQKRQDWLQRLAPKSNLPIVWCFNDQTGWNFQIDENTNNLISLKNLTQEELYYVYRNATAFVSFSQWESFGWTLAEAFLHDLPIIASNTGLITYIPPTPGLHRYRDDTELATILALSDFGKPAYNHDLLLNRTFAKVIPACVEAARLNRPLSDGDE
jgi:glycosyltransferase involved in cell wall biosynthesis